MPCVTVLTVSKSCVISGVTRGIILNIPASTFGFGTKALPIQQKNLDFS